jgi:hypothetical protein
MGEEEPMIIACPLQSEPLRFSLDQVTETRLERATAVAQFPWLLPAVMRLRDLEMSGAHIPGIGDIRISEPTGDAVRRLLSRITLTDLPTPDVVPISGGGIGLRWELPRREVAFTIYPNRAEFNFVASADDEIVSEGVIKVDETRRINNLLGHLAAAE